MAPGRRVTERMGQLVASAARGRTRPSLPSCVGGIWWPRQGPLWCDTHAERHTEGLEPPRLGPRSPWETWCHQASDRGGVLCMFVCVIPSWKQPPPLLRTLATARHHIPMVTPLLSLLIKIREIYLCMHTQHMHTQDQQVAGLALHSRPTSKVIQTCILCHSLK